MHNSIVAEYLELLDDQRVAIFSEIKGIETSPLWQRPAEKEWSMGENIDHGRVLLRSFRKLLKIIWPILSPYAKLKRHRYYEVLIHMCLGDGVVDNFF